MLFKPEVFLWTFHMAAVCGVLSSNPQRSSDLPRKTHAEIRQRLFSFPVAAYIVNGGGQKVRLHEVHDGITTSRGVWPKQLRFYGANRQQHRTYGSKDVYTEQNKAHCIYNCDQINDKGNTVAGKNQTPNVSSTTLRNAVVWPKKDHVQTPSYKQWKPLPHINYYKGDMPIDQLTGKIEFPHEDIEVHESVEEYSSRRPSEISSDQVHPDQNATNAKATGIRARPGKRVDGSEFFGIIPAFSSHDQHTQPAQHSQNPTSN